jgi:hypothetical protein
MQNKPAHPRCDAIAPTMTRRASVLLIQVRITVLAA